MQKTINLKKQLKISLPIAFESLINILMTMIDTLVIALVGTKELAALGAMGVILSLMQMSAQTVNISNNTLVANALGENNNEKVKLLAGNSIILTVIISIFTIMLIAIIQPLFPPLFKVDKIAITYLTIRLFGFVQNSLVTVLSGYQRTIGKQKNILLLRIFAVILNLILDIVTVLNGFGIVGVALATIFIDTLLSIYLIMYSKKNIKIKYISELFKSITKLFKWNFMERIVSKIDNFIFNLIVARMGNLQYSVHVILLQIANMYEAFMQGFGDGITISIGIAFGRKDNKYIAEVKKISKQLIKYSEIILPCIVLVVSIIIMKFTLIEKELQIIFLNVLPLFLLSSYVTTSATYYFSILRGYKDFKFLANRNLISSTIKILVAIILSFTPLGIVGVWIGFLIYGISQKTLSMVRYNKLKL